MMKIFTFWISVIVVTSSLFVSGCHRKSGGGSGADSNDVVPENETSQVEIKNQFDLLGVPDETAFQDRTFTFKPTAVSPFQDGTFEIEDAPSWLGINTTTGEVSGKPTDLAAQFIYKIVSISPLTTENVGQYPLTVHGNPLKKFQWHLTNTGQKSFSDTAGTVNEDINMAQTVDAGLTGLGVRIAISDTAAELAHESLTDNVLVNESRDYSLTAPYRTNVFAKLLGDTEAGEKAETHATAVAGVLAARGWSNLGTRGVAPFANFAVFNAISWSVPANKVSEAMLNQLTGNFDIVNQSWGYNDVSYSMEFDWDYNALQRTEVLSGRNGKGKVFVKAAGNGYDICNHPSEFCSQDISSDPNNATPYVITVGAVDANGKKSSYSAVGSALWVSAPGGEFGDDDPAILTTDLSGCSEGKSKASATVNSFDKGTAAENPACNYTSAFNGTSAAAPIISGVVALLLEANPTLTWRDIKHIFAKTSSQVDADFDPIVLTNSYVYEPGWITNAAGYKFHNWYGFGRVNVDDAVAMAKIYDSNLGSFKDTFDYSTPSNPWRWRTADSLGIAIPDDDPDGITGPGIFVQDDFIIEAVQIQVDITHPYPMDLAIELTSPSGTKSVMLHALNSYSDPDLIDLVLLSNAFYAENSRGNWRIKVIDINSADVGTLNNWKINISGR